MEDILVCYCGWRGTVDEQDALGSECGCCPDCGNEQLVWLTELQTENKELKERRKAIICEFCGIHLVYDEKNLRDVAQKMREHYKECTQNPLVGKINTLRGLIGKVVLCFPDTIPKGEEKIMFNIPAYVIEELKQASKET